MESTREWSRCPHCGFRCRKVWDRRPKRVRDLEVSGRRTTLVWRRRRFWCGNCGECHLEDHAQFRGVEIVVSDGSRSYQAAIAQYLPDARHVLDRFHVARVRHEALCFRVRVRDPCRWAVTAVR